MGHSGTSLTMVMQFSLAKDTDHRRADMSTTDFHTNLKEARSQMFQVLTVSLDKAINIFMLQMRYRRQISFVEIFHYNLFKVKGSKYITSEGSLFLIISCQAASSSVVTTASMYMENTHPADTPRSADVRNEVQRFLHQWFQHTQTHQGQDNLGVPTHGHDQQLLVKEEVDPGHVLLPPYHQLGINIGFPILSIRDMIKVTDEITMLGLPVPLNVHKSHWRVRSHTQISSQNNLKIKYHYDFPEVESPSPMRIVAMVFLHVRDTSLGQSEMIIPLKKQLARDMDKDMKDCYDSVSPKCMPHTSLGQ